MRKGERLLTCPDCAKRGVYWKAARHGEDAYRCRYCWWFAFTQGGDTTDKRELGLLQCVNPDKVDL